MVTRIRLIELNSSNSALLRSWTFKRFLNRYLNGEPVGFWWLNQLQELIITNWWKWSSLIEGRERKGGGQAKGEASMNIIDRRPPTLLFVSRITSLSSVPFVWCLQLTTINISFNVNWFNCAFPLFVRSHRGPLWIRKSLLGSPDVRYPIRIGLIISIHCLDH